MGRTAACLNGGVGPAPTKCMGCGLARPPQASEALRAGAHLEVWILRCPLPPPCLIDAKKPLTPARLSLPQLFTWPARPADPAPPRPPEAPAQCTAAGWPHGVPACPTCGKEQARIHCLPALPSCSLLSQTSPAVCPSTLCLS